MTDQTPDGPGPGAGDHARPDAVGPELEQDTTEDDASRGRVRYQDPETTTPREPTVAEQRARREAEKRRQAQEAAAAEAQERQQKKRKRLLVGGGVAVGLVAVVAIAYAASSDGDEVSAQCTDQTGVVVPDDTCANAQQHGGYYDTAGHFVPLFIPFGGFGGNQYHYNYGSSSPIGTVARGGSTSPPASGTTLRGSSGSSIGSSSGSGTVSRGGLGVGGSSSSSGKGSSGSSSGS